MIDNTTAFLVDQLNRFLATRVTGKGPHVVLGSPVSPDGPVTLDITDKVVVTLLNIEREYVAANTSNAYTKHSGGIARSAPPLNLNLILLISANYPSSYETGLKLLSAILAFFQGHPIFNRQNAPTLPQSLKRLTFEWQDMNLQTAHNMWAGLGGKYLPCAIYKARMLIFEDAWLGDDVPLITGTKVETN